MRIIKKGNSEIKQSVTTTASGGCNKNNHGPHCLVTK